MEFTRNPFVEEIDLKYKTKNIPRTLRRIKRNIDKGIYISLTWDESAISCRPNYIQDHYKHPVLIYGYDLNMKYFNILGFSERGVFESRTISFSEFEKAYKFYNTSKWKYFFWISQHDKKFNMKYFNKTISWYLNSQYPTIYRLIISRSLLKDKCFGVSVYDFLLSLLCKEKKESNLGFNILKSLTAYCEHKQYLLNAFKFIKHENLVSSDIDSIINKYEIIEKEFRLVKNLQLKYMATSSLEIVDKMIEKVILIHDLEVKTLEQYLASLKNCGVKSIFSC